MVGNKCGIRRVIELNQSDLIRVLILRLGVEFGTILLRKRLGKVLKSTMDFSTRNLHASSRFQTNFSGNYNEV